MVVFTCNHCGESIQKPKVEKHYQFSCRNSKFLTCVDCFKDFRDEEFVAHTKCITEDERYAAKGTYTNGIVKKGEIKQESWVEMIKSIINKEKNLSPSHRNLLNTISSCNNVPRKKNKFINFLKSSSGGRVNFNDVEAVWNIIEKYKKESQTNKMNTTINDNKSNGMGNKRKLELNEDKSEMEIKKIKNNSDNGTSDNDTKCLIHDGAADKFSFQQKILEILQKKGSLSIKKLEKKLVKAYLKYMGEINDQEKLVKKINKKLKKVQGIKIEDDNVSLITER